MQDNNTSATPYNVTADQIARTESAKALHIALAAVNITEIDVVTMDRHIPRKDQAAAARALFRKLGLKGISVTAPNYSMAQSVNVNPPKRTDYDRSNLTAWGTVEAARCPVCKANHDAEVRLDAILSAAFPNSDNRSDYSSDHFDYRWSIH